MSNENCCTQHHIQTANEVCRCDLNLAIHTGCDQRQAAVPELKLPVNGECTIIQENCNESPNHCGHNSLPCKNCSYRSNNRLKCDDETFNRWRSVYEMTTGHTGMQLLLTRADCRRRPQTPGRCELCNICDGIYLNERRCKKYAKPYCKPLICDGDYQSQHPLHNKPPPMIMTNPRYCSKNPSMDCYKNPGAETKMLTDSNTPECGCSKALVSKEMPKFEMEGPTQYHKQCGCFRHGDAPDPLTHY